MMNNWNGEEKRKFPRYLFNADVLLGLEDGSGKHLFQYQGYCKNIGREGIRIKLLRYKDAKCPEIKEGAKVQVRISLWSTKQYLELTGQVVWRSQDEKGSNIGVRFPSNDNKGKKVLLFQLVEDVRKKVSGDKNNVRIIRNVDLARGKVNY